MGSKEIKAMGLTGAGDRLRGDPLGFTIVDVDIPRADLLALYDGKPTEQALINAVKQERRSFAIAGSDPDFTAFVDSCRPGVTDEAYFYRLKPDVNGREWKIIVRGNNRCAALRAVNAERVAAGQTPFLLPVIQAARPGSGDEAAAFAEEMHALSNVRVRMKPSQSAEQAAKFAARGMTAEGIRRYIDGNPSTEEVAALVILDGLCDEIKDACDAGRVKVLAVATLAGKSDDAQRTWLAKRTAPRAVKAPAPRRPTAKRVEAFMGELPDTIRQAMMLASGKLSIDAVTDEDVRFAWKRSEGGK